VRWPTSSVRLMRLTKQLHAANSCSMLNNPRAQEMHGMRKGKAKVNVGTALLIIAFVLYIVVPWAMKLWAVAAIRADEPIEEAVLHMSFSLYSMLAALLVGITGLVTLIVGAIQLRRHKKAQLEHPAAFDKA
jgi:uncharacterized Tic20 family protein